MNSLGEIQWSTFTPFPNPIQGEYIYAPFGIGIYELINVKTNELILVGKGNNVANRMSSLLPEPYGCGTRENENKRNYVWKNIKDIHYRTAPYNTQAEALKIEKQLRKINKYLFNT